MHELPAMRRIAVERRKEADPIGCWIPTDNRLIAWGGPLGPMKRLGIMGGALLDALKGAKPIFHYSVVNGRVMRTDGTTIFVTGRTRGGGETIVATWDHGESKLEMLGRLNQQRILLDRLPHEVAYQFMRAMEFPELPPPQALISDCIAAGEKEPQTSLFGCGAGAPISVAVGIEKTHFCLDHRLFDPPHMVRLTEMYSEQLEEALRVDSLHGD